MTMIYYTKINKLFTYYNNLKIRFFFSISASSELDTPGTVPATLSAGLCALLNILV